MLIHVHFLWNHIDILLAAVILVIVIKTLVVASVVKGFRYNNKTSLLVGMSLAQIGEFAFVLLSRASNVHIVEGKLYLLLLGTTALSLLVPGGSPDEQESLVFATLAGDLILIHLSKKIAGKIAGIDPLEQITKRCIRIVETTETDVDGCALCRGPGFSKSVFGPQTVILCDQCEKEYHIGCLKEHKMDDLKELPKGKWFCCMDCNRVHSALQNLVVSGEQKLQDSLLSIIKKKLEEKGSESSADLDIKWRLLSGQMASDNTRLLLSKAVSIFHIYGDPEAADIVFTSGANIVIIGINIQHKS